jgi:gamma-glutamyltranspeptidase/glutathione hydrolase
MKRMVEWSPGKWPAVVGLCVAAAWAGPAALAFQPSAAPQSVEDIQPEAATHATSSDVHAPARAANYMVSSANPWATKAGVAILAARGSATDAAIAAQMVLNLVEPQSSGIGGGAFVVTFDAAAQRVQAWDGRETAPAAARSGRFMQGGSALEFADAVNSGRSVGTPGLLRVLALMHEQHGRLPWADLFEPAIDLAEQGFPVSERLHALLAGQDALRAQRAAASYFYDERGVPWPVGHRLRNPALARTLRKIAVHGPRAFYEGPIAQRMVDAVAAHNVPGDLALQDLAGYQALERDPLCGIYKVYLVCGMPPPSAGPLTVLQMLGILSHTPLADLTSDSLQAVHLFAEAGKLAFADRDAYVADPDFVDVPVQALLHQEYLASRARLIRMDKAMAAAPAGNPARLLSVPSPGNTPELPSTTHVVAVDADGNVVSMTSTIESAFGSKIFVDGFLLNNQLTDFSLTDVDAHGALVRNRVEPGKRPRSSMAPMLVLKEGRPVVAIGSPGGSAIINYVAKTLLGVLDWKMNIQEAISLPNRGSQNRSTYLEKGTSLHTLVPGLTALGHVVSEVDLPSGLQGIVLTPDGLQGGADPRREGLAAGG